MGQEVVKKDTAKKDFKELLESDKVKARLAQGVVGKNPAQFASTLLTIFKSNEQLAQCEPYSILTAAIQAINVGLRIEPTFGQAYIVPFKGQATFQIGWRGYVQLAQNTGLYSTLNAGEVYEGEVRGRNPMSGELIIGERTSDRVIGYSAFFRLLNGFEKSLYMTVSEIENHAKKYSQSYQADKNKSWSIWATNFDSMAKKTILKLLLKNWGPLSTELREAMASDFSAAGKDGYKYVDNGDIIGSHETEQPKTEFVPTEKK